MLFIVLILFGVFSQIKSIDLLPCTEGVTAADMALAERLLTASTPPEYRLIDFFPITQTGRNPHRWVCRFERRDDTYSHDCDYLVAARTSIKRRCPAGSELSQVAVSEAPPNRSPFQSNLYTVKTCQFLNGFCHHSPGNQYRVGSRSYFIKQGNRCRCNNKWL